MIGRLQLMGGAMCLIHCCSVVAVVWLQVNCGSLSYTETNYTIFFKVSGCKKFILATLKKKHVES